MSAKTALGTGDRPRDPRPAADADEDVLRLRALVRRRAERPHLPDLPRASRLAAGHQRAGRPLRDPDRPRARLRHRRALDLPPQELLLSRQPEGVPDQPVRLTAVRRRAPRRRPHPPRAPRGGRGEARPRVGLGPDPRLRDVGGRLQPRRHAARRDRYRARPARRRNGPRVARPAAHDDPPARRLRREHGGGQPALRRQHLAAARRARTSSGPRPSSRT